jgi:hypothetical protein
MGVRSAIALGICIIGAFPSEAGSNCETIYRLTEKASYQEGCFPPCMCPIMMASGIRGTFVVGPAIAHGSFFSYEVFNVNWVVTLGDTEYEITGFGTYQVSSGPPPLVQSLDLSLSVDGGQREEFSSGLVPLITVDPSIDIQVSINDLYCYDTVIVVNAAPLSDDSLLQFRFDADSTYQKGCFDPCDCPLEMPRQLDGYLTLVPVLEYGTYVEYSVAQAYMVALPVDGANDEIELNGFGTYTLAQGFAGPAHHLALILQANDGTAERFSSTFENTDPTFPASFDIVVDINDQVCSDTVLSINATGLGQIVFRDDFECGDHAAWSSATVP